MGEKDLEKGRLSTSIDIIHGSKAALSWIRGLNSFFKVLLLKVNRLRACLISRTRLQLMN